MSARIIKLFVQDHSVMSTELRNILRPWLESFSYDFFGVRCVINLTTPRSATAWTRDGQMRTVSFTFWNSLYILKTSIEETAAYSSVVFFMSDSPSLIRQERVRLSRRLLTEDWQPLQMNLDALCWLAWKRVLCYVHGKVGSSHTSNVKLRKLIRTRYVLLMWNKVNLLF